MTDGTGGAAKKPVKRAKRATATTTAAAKQNVPAKRVITARGKGTTGKAQASKTIAAAKAKPLASKQKKAPAAKKPGECIHI
jgi:hypothetical protein